MRKILFRGKRIDKGEWVYGYLAVYTDGSCYITTKIERNITRYVKGKPFYIISCMEYEVDPRTVGQYTGLMDRNGVEIFEGDICRAAVYKDPITLRKSTMINSLVVFRNGEFTLDGHKRLPGGFRTLPTLHGCEVIGNIHDNPEHLEVE